MTPTQPLRLAYKQIDAARACGVSVRTFRNWKATHHARRAHCWWVILRKGKCEPRANYPSSLVGRFSPGRDSLFADRTK